MEETEIKSYSEWKQNVTKENASYFTCLLAGNFIDELFATVNKFSILHHSVCTDVIVGSLLTTIMVMMMTAVIKIVTKLD